MVLTFRCAEGDVDALRGAGDPFFKPMWFDNIIGLALSDGVDWKMIAELVIDSYCVMAPRKLAEQVSSRRR